MLIIELILSLSVLVALSVISGFIDNRYHRSSLIGVMLQGVLFGLTAIVGMLYPFVLTEGIIFDGRSIVVSLSTLFFGPITGLIASIIAITYRISLGGVGALTGSLVVASSYIIGLIFFQRRKQNAAKILSKLELYIFGIVVHISMMTLMIILPSKNLPEVYKTITLTVLGIYPLITLIIGKILLDQEENQLLIKKLFESERVFVHSMDMLCIAGFDGFFKTLNPAWEKTLGWTKEELLSKKWTDFIFKDDIDSTIEKNIELVKGLQVNQFENRYICKDGTLKWLSWNSYPYKDEKLIFAVARDITEKKKMEVNLQKALEKAEESDRIKSSLLLNMSHEFRTPMTGVLGMASILKERVSESNDIIMIDGIIQSGKRLMNTLDSVLEFANLEANRVKLTEELAFVGKSINKVKEDLEILANEKHLDLKYNTVDERLAVRMSERNLQIILNKLIDNAIKYTESGYVIISTDYLKENGEEYVKISVKDSGIGISEQHYDLIFEEFRQVSEGTARIYEGSGLGLPIVKKLVGLANGKITVDSKIGEGSTFSIYLPCVFSEVKREIEMLEKPIEMFLMQESLPDLLLVEDNLINKIAVVSFLKNICNVEHAKTGEAAIMKAIEKKYSVILMDINLGSGIDGIECSKSIRKISGYENVPIVAVTGYSMESDKLKILSEGLTHYLVKPFTKNELSNLVVSILSRLN